MIKRLTKREQKIFFVCVSMIFIYASYNTLIKPLQERIISLDEQIEAQELRLGKSLRTIRKGAALEEQYRQYQNTFKQKKSNEQLMSSILSEIEDVAGELDLRISALKPKQVRKEEYYNRFSVSLTIDSNFDDILQFIHILQNPPHMFDVVEVRFDKGSRRKSKTLKTQLVLGKITIP